MNWPDDSEVNYERVEDRNVSQDKLSTPFPHSIFYSPTYAKKSIMCTYGYLHK